MSASETAGSSFGANSWLVEEMYEQYRSDPESVGESWREFFEDYRSVTAPAHPEMPQPAADTAAVPGESPAAPPAQTPAPSPGPSPGPPTPTPAPTPAIIEPAEEPGEFA